MNRVCRARGWRLRIGEDPEVHLYDIEGSTLIDPPLIQRIVICTGRMFANHFAGDSVVQEFTTYSPIEDGCFDHPSVPDSELCELCKRLQVMEELGW